MNRATVYADDPAAQAMLFAEQGAEFLHVVDLDGAFAGRPENAEAVEGIIEISRLYPIGRRYPQPANRRALVRYGRCAARDWHSSA
jgi:hypothetical protein